jgi:putative phosphoribosyl transferase
MSHVFLNRTEAGQSLAAALRNFRGTPDLLVLGIPRGGIPVAFEVARVLRAPLDVFVVRKLGLPSDPECAMGALASGGVRILNADVIAALGIRGSVIDAVARGELKELERRELAYRGSTTPPVVRHKTVILVDDGIATGASIKAAIKALRALKPERLIVAVPASSRSSLAEIQPLVDETVVLEIPEPFHAVAQSYAEFPQTSDTEVTGLLQKARAWTRLPTPRTS